MHRRQPLLFILLASLLLLLGGLIAFAAPTAEPAQAHNPAISQAQEPGAPAACSQNPLNGGPKERFRVVDAGNNRLFGFNMGDQDNVNWGDPKASAGSGDGELNNPQGVGHVIGAGTYVADTGNDRIQVFDWKLRYDSQFDGSDGDEGALDAPTDVAIGKDHTVYVADSGNDRIMVFNKKGEFQESWGSTGGDDGEFRNPYAIAFSRGGEQVYVVDRDNDRVQYFDKNGNYLGQWNSGGGSFHDPTGVSVHPTSGDVYVADRLRDEVVQFEADGTYIRSWGSEGSGNGEFNGPMDVAATPVHGVFVADTGNDRIQRFTDGGSFIEAFSSDGDGNAFSGPTAVTARLTGVRMQECYIHNFTLDGEPRQITVFYTHNSGLPRHHIPDVSDGDGANVYAREVAELTEQAWRTFDSYGLKEPAHKRNDVELANGETGDDLNIWMFGETLAGRCCHGWGYSIKARTVERSVDRNNENAFQVVVHELFHSIQFNHGYGQGSQPGFHWEGGAANAEDKVDAGLDDDPGSHYMGRVGHYLGNSHQSDLRDLKYVAGLFWTYFQEQLTDGSMSEPAYGIDATDTLMRDILTDYRGLDGVAQALRQMDDQNRSLEAFWIDFTTANYVKDFSGAGPEHGYVDDDALPNNYRSAATETAALNSATASTFFTGTLKAYSAHYYRVRPDNATCPYVMVEVDGDKRLALTLANHRGGSLIAPLETRKGDRLAVTLRTEQPLAGSDDGAGVILTGLREKGDYRVDATCITPTLNIVTPNNGHPGFAGPHDDAGTLIVTVEVSNGGAAPVKGLSSEQFTATVGGAEATVLNASYIDDLYVLVLDAPNQSAAGLYNLQVTLDGDQSDSETDAVKYTSQVRDNMLTLDRSGSMGDENKMFTAQQAAQLQITDMDRNAWAGLVSFDDVVSLDFELQDITGEPERGDLRGAVNGLSPGDTTNIVAGVDRSLDELDANGGDEHACFVTLLSDGKDNEATPAEAANLIDRLNSGDCQVYAVALGPEADKTLLQEIADASGGELYVSTISPGGARPESGPESAPQSAAAASSGYGDATWEHRLMGFFEEIALQQEGRERLYVGASPSAGTYTDTIVVDDSLSELVFAVQNDTLYGQTVIIDPQGTVVNVELYPGLTYQATTYHRFYRIENPIAGEWTVENISYATSSFPGHLVTASGHTPVGLELIARAPTGPLEAGEAVPIVAMLHDDEGLLPGAEISATVRSSSGATTQLTLFDDGDHGDGEAGDGVYANLFRGATAAPCHTDPETQETFCDEGFQVDATAVLDDVRREASTAFSITTATDSDGDTMPDNWEERNGTDPHDSGDMYDDDDGDGLPNVDEFWFGTDPQRADSDGGGENDISEIYGGGDPLDPGDDRVDPLYGIHLRPGDGEIGIVYTPRPDLDSISIYRRQPGSDTWDTVVTGEPIAPSGVYTDTGVTNGVAYEYRLVPTIPGGFGGAPVISIPAMPAVDTDAPEGMLTINDGAARTTDKRVTLSLDYEDDAVDMRLSNDGDFGDDAWEPVAATREWDLAGDVASGDVAVVYVQYRDADGNVGFDIYQQDSILYQLEALYLPAVIDAE